MRLSPVQKDRAAGVLLGQAVGDALGVPYEFGPRISPGSARMVGGGLGPYAPGEWSDDTQMAVCIARVAATGQDLTSEEALDAVANGFLGWRADGATDIGYQTSTVLGAGRRGPGAAARLTAAAEGIAASGRAGNGALMRTAIVGVASLDDPAATARAAARIAALTHADARCVDSSVLWSEAVRVAVLEGRFDVRSGLSLVPAERRGQWEGWLDEAESLPAASFAHNGFTVTALQAAWAAIWSTRHVKGPDHLLAALQSAVGIGHDTDTVAAIAGGLLGARYGASGIATDLARRVHGWPGFRGRDLVGLATAAATHDPAAWHTKPSRLSGLARPLAVAHLHDPQVLLGTEADLARIGELGVTAVVSLSRVGDPEVAGASLTPGKHAEVWLIDSEEPAGNAHLAWTIADAARTIAEMRRDGERVLLHCVHAHHRTPAVALAYSLHLGVDTATAISSIEEVFGRRSEGLLWQTARTLHFTHNLDEP